MNLPHFGEVEIEADGCAFVLKEITLGGRRSNASLSLTHPAPALGRVTELLKVMEGMDETARSFILQEYDHRNDTVVEFAAFHLEEAGDLIARKYGSQSVSERTVLSNLELRGICIIGTPDEDTAEVVVDYSIDRTFTDGILAVKFDASGSIVCVAHES